ncbi:MAG: flagellar basal body P-ring formation protein FlgA [Limnohabitans sp.]|nr:flagellar basal body P-ring formation protein FlgA [Limnohabitans sp.]
MSNMSVKTSTPALKRMQILCLTMATWFMGCGVGFAQTSPQMGSQASMFNQVKSWMAETHKVKSEEVTIAPLDPRVQIQACSKSLTVDHPFSSKDTVRVRCVDPAWQVYLQVSMPVLPPVAMPNATASISGKPLISGASNAPAAVAAPIVKTVVVPKRLIQRGTIIEAEMLEEVTQTGGNVDNSMLQSLKDALTAEAVRDLSAGQVLRSSDIRRAILVKQGQQVTMNVGEKSGFLVTLRVEALQDGRMGEQVRLKNTESGRQISGVVVGPNLVRGLQ